MTISMPSRPGSIVSSKFGLETNSQTFTSPLTRNVQRVLLGGARWTFSFTIRKMKNTEPAAADWIAYLLSLQGMVNTFNAYDPDRITPRGVATGSPLVNGGSQTGTSLITDGWTHSVTGIMKAGDYFGVNGELKQLTADANSDGSGNSTLTFQPALRSSPPDNAVLTVQQPTCTMILADDNQAMWDCDKNGVYQEKTIVAYEVFG